MATWAATINKELAWTKANTKKAAERKLKRRYMKKFGRADLTDIREIEPRETRLSNQKIISNGLLNGKINEGNFDGGYFS